MLGSIPPSFHLPLPTPSSPLPSQQTWNVKTFKVYLKRKQLFIEKRIFCWWLQLLIKSKNTVYNNKKVYGYCISAVPTHLWPFSKSKFNLKSDRVNLVAPASPIECLLYLPNVRAMQYKLGPERFTRPEIQMYYGCPCNFICHTIEKYNLLLIFLHFF